VCKFRHLIEQHNLGDKLFHLVNQFLKKNGLKVSRGTIVDASTIHAPSSTKNKKKQRDPEMHQTRKGLAHFHAYVWSSVVAHNLALFSRLVPTWGH